MDQFDLCDDVGCMQKFTCSGTASCAAADETQAPLTECTGLTENDAGCSWDGLNCTGNALPCTDAVYQQNWTGCEDVGCTLAITCVGGDAYYDCSLQTDQADCSMYYAFCVWE